ncbi:S-adenosyl-L-methionine-dependent tRNA 4-demethylwyosine synthase [Elysia marginata]|uniref:S-adenosyl-L-methionine-dependent tRNA 4-demethylwyosine synthase n=1 Tax=Elysia marginata TaxID=1093978 RepID=A0AAV4J6L6_9GAST|nr:S-adenosyl-L-methionine-dependent tRNA 4-demethylwyosine synthase [Elysia marginata]
MSDEEDDEDDQSPGQGTADVMDLEDLGKVMHQAAQAKRQNGKVGAGDGPRDMITPLLRESLEKQGYKLIGSHSGVKLCRWTKSMLRGRGGCYKHTFYGIESHRCMETTPSLACANKCVFCWRHHTNPVGTEWKWTMDEPQAIFDGALNNHTKLIKQFRGDCSVTMCSVCVTDLNL